MTRRPSLLLIAFALGCAGNSVPPKSEPALGLGHSEFSITCAADAQRPFLRGLLALHSFFYDEARAEFEKAVSIDPSCAMGHWGVALANGEQLWSWHDTTTARAAAAKAVALRGRLTPKEVALVDALAVLVGRDGDGRPVEARVRAYVEELRRIYARWPEDDDIAAFFALGLIYADDPAPLRDRMQAGAIALAILARNPKHPGALHYAIHAFDDPEHAVLALPAARAYAAVAPEAPHARHMPSHIFVELGNWAEAASSCESAWQVSLMRVERLKQTRDHADLHSLSWLPPIYMQLGQRARADESLATFSKIVETEGVAGLVLIETVMSVLRDSDGWERLESLLAPIEKALPMLAARFASKSPDATPVASLVRASRAAARAIGAARRHDVVSARRYQAELDAARDEAAKVAPGYAARTPYQTSARATSLRVNAEIAIAEGNVSGADDIFRQILPLEAAEFASDGAYPGRMSACERWGELAFGAGRAREAAEHFACALERTPGRSRTLRLAALAAERSGDSARAHDYRQMLAQNWTHADADFAGLAELRARAR